MYDKFVIMFCIGMIEKNIMSSVTYIASRSPSTDNLISQALAKYKRLWYFCYVTLNDNS